MKIGKREQLIIYFTVLTFAILIFHQVIYKPQKRELVRIQEEIQAVEANLETVNRIIPALSGIEKELLQERAKWIRLETCSPRQVVQFVKQLAQESSRLQLNLVSIKPLEELESGSAGPKKITFRIQMRSQFQAFSAFLRALEESAFVPAVVEDFQILKKEGDEMGLNLDILINVSSYTT